MFFHVTFQRCCLNGMYASVAFSDHYAFQHSDKGGFTPPSPEAVSLQKRSNSLTSCLGGGLYRPAESNHSFVFFFFFLKDFCCKFTCGVDGALSILELWYSHTAASKTIDTMSFQSLSLKVSSRLIFAKIEARRIAFVFWFLGGYYEEYVRKPNLTSLCGFHTVLDRDGWSVPGGTSYPH